MVELLAISLALIGLSLLAMERANPTGWIGALGWSCALAGAVSLLGNPTATFLSFPVSFALLSFYFKRGKGKEAGADGKRRQRSEKRRL
jgi:membrane protein implicated in regulation of membrane protease activity